MSRNAARVLEEGVTAGLVASLSAMALFAMLDLIGGRSIFHTPAAMGSVLLGLAGPAARAGAALPTLAYTALHVGGSIVIALFAAFQLLETERHRSLWYFPFAVLIAGFVYAVTLIGVFGVEVGGAVGWRTVVAGTVVWTLAMTAWLARAHRGLGRRIQHDLEVEA